MKKKRDKRIKNENERVPAPAVSRKSRKKRVGCWVLAALTLVGAFFAGFGVRWWTLDSEMRALINVKNKIDEEYYWGLSDEEFYGALFDAVNNDLLDKYSAYLTEEDAVASEQEIAGNRSGFGIEFITQTETGEDQILITRVLGNSPAEEAGLRIGERIVGYGKDETSMTMEENSETFLDFLAQQGEGERFCLCVESAGGQRFVETGKAAYVENNVFYRTSTKAYAFTGVQAEKLTERGEPLTVLPEDTAYVRLIRFGGNAVSGMRAAMALFKAQGKKNLILDLRGNGGGYLEDMQEIAGYFCKTTEKEPVVAVADYGKRKEKFTASNVYAQYFSKDSRICVIADEYSASASECLIGCMVDYKTTEYGDICLIENDGVAKTFGKGIMQSTYKLSWLRGDSIRLTTARILWPLSGNCIHDRGVLQSDGTKSVKQSYEGETELESAIKALFSAA
ncbi:MAG: hypothetical protein E7380_06010 [Clostridiales bacterium]|nr:hypothetical protein [Clostridiales bacterium]